MMDNCHNDENLKHQQAAICSASKNIKSILKIIFFEWSQLNRQCTFNTSIIWLWNKTRTIWEIINREELSFTSLKGVPVCSASSMNGSSNFGWLRISLKNWLVCESPGTLARLSGCNMFRIRQRSTLHIIRYAFRPHPRNFHVWNNTSLEYWKLKKSFDYSLDEADFILILMCLCLLFDIFSWELWPGSNGATCYS